MKTTLSLLFFILSSFCWATDSALSVIEKTTEENKQKNLPPAVETSSFGISADLGLPHPLTFAFEYEHPSHEFSGDVSFGSFTLPTSDADLKITSQEITFRWHPRLNALYMGLSVGSHSIRAQESGTFGAQNSTITVDVDGTYVKPVAGWLWKKPEKNLFFGFELGIQLPMDDKVKFKSSADLTGNSAYDKKVEDVTDLAELFGKTSMISVALVKVGWMF